MTSVITNVSSVGLWIALMSQWFGCEVLRPAEQQKKIKVKQKMNVCPWRQSLTHCNTIQHISGVDWEFGPNGSALLSTLFHFDPCCYHFHVVWASWCQDTNSQFVNLCTWCFEILLYCTTNITRQCADLQTNTQTNPLRKHTESQMIICCCCCCSACLIHSRFPLFVIDAVHSGESKHNCSHNMICNHQPTQWKCFKHVAQVSGWDDDQQCD